MHSDALRYIYVNHSSMRIVLLAKTGVGKSAAGNTILGWKEFKSAMNMNSVTRKCSVKDTTVSGRSVSVVDTPGFFDSQMNKEDLAKEIARSVWLSSPGPHAFLIMFPVNMRFTEQEQQIPQKIKKMFGEEVLNYSIILFTYVDLLEANESIEKLIKENCRLRFLVQQCGGRYHVFNNRDINNRKQVEDLLQKIDSMVQQNGGAHYTNEMYEKAQRSSGFEDFFANNRLYFVAAASFAIGFLGGSIFGPLTAVVSVVGTVVGAVSAGFTYIFLAAGEDKGKK